MISCPHCKKLLPLTEKHLKGRTIVCPGCGGTLDTDGKVSGQVRLEPPPLPPGGPGTELAKLFKEYGIKPRKSCGCESWTRKMDAWGAAGCDEHRAEILAHLKTAYDLTGFWEKTKAAATAILRGLPLSLPAALDEAVVRARQEAEHALAEADAYLGATA